ncbi:N-acetyltransferase 9 [Podila humilis]|nr:N-acetyltransferase 9 [Podila humilis]
MTASEPLTLEEEYEMQESWHVDENKCTFIILARNNPDLQITAGNVLEQKMVGDVNLFFNDHDDPHSAEIEIMIAEPDYRRQGMGLEAIRMMITYAFQSLNTTRITAKISTENKGSIQLFLTQLGFVQISYSQIFEEVTLEKCLSHALADGVAAAAAAAGNRQDGSLDETVVVAENNNSNKLQQDATLTQARFETLELDPKEL